MIDPQIPLRIHSNRFATSRNTEYLRPQIWYIIWPFKVKLYKRGNAGIYTGGYWSESYGFFSVKF